MRNTSFSVTIPVTVTVCDRVWELRATVSPQGWDSEPAVLWLDNTDPERFFIPEPVWDAVQDELSSATPARAAFEAAINTAPLPFMAEAAE
jgi:hypothetical protein